MKVGYFIQAHNHPEQVYRLIRTLKRFSADALIIIGYDFTNSSINMESLHDLSNIYLLKGDFLIKRGEFSILKPYLNAIDWLLKENIEFDWLAYISGQCYPIKPIESIENFLLTSKYDGFIQYCDFLSPENDWDWKYRYFYQYYTFPDNQFFRIIVKLLNKLKINKLLSLKFIINFNNDNNIKIGIPPKKIPFNNQNICYGGNQRHILSRKCVEFIKHFINTNPALVKYYKKTLIPEESLIQTILVNSHRFNLYNHHKMYDDYSDNENNNGRPKTLTIEDYPKIIESEDFFARKFEPDSELLNMLDSRIFSTFSTKVNH